MDDAVRIAFEAGLPYAGLRDFRPDGRLLDAVPPGWPQAHRALPLALDGDRLTLAAAQPDPDLSDLDPAYTIDVVISPEGEIADALARLPAPAAPEQARLARRLGLPVVDLGEHRPDRTALATIDPDLQRRLRAVPLALDATAIYIAIADPLDPTQLTALRAAAGEREVRYLAADGAALDDLLGSLHGARWAAAVAAPERRAVTRPAAIAVITAALVAGLVVATTPTAIILMALVAITALVALIGLIAPPTHATAADTTAARTTLLLPLRDGIGATVHAATTLAALDQAPDEVLLLVDARDDAARRAAAALARDATQRVIATPPQLPTTRAAMLAYGRHLARGEHVAVLDPGDIPAPAFLRHASAALTRHPRATAVQARIVPTHRAARAALWHRALAPGLARLRIPFPLAATAHVVRSDATTPSRRPTTIPDTVATTR
ncbi:MAG TPA: glycosyltransferase [Baekduia sp.]|nr:glycosyltransferase [Baekduia sp.]